MYVLPFLHYANVFLLQKLKRRQTALFKTNALNQAQKEKWAPCIVAEMMSSEVMMIMEMKKAQCLWCVLSHGGVIK